MGGVRCGGMNSWKDRWIEEQSRINKDFEILDGLREYGNIIQR
jgi:hypothetical protein